LISPAITFTQKPDGPVRPIPVPEAPLPTPPKAKPSKYKPEKMSVKERFEGYLLGREVRPWFIVNNIDPFEEKTDVTAGGHRVKWTYTPKEETRIDIDGDIFTLNGKMSLNALYEGGGMEEVDFADSWDQIKLYDLGDRQLIGISMGSHPCTGIGCSVTFFLIYDLKTKNKSFFGSFRITQELKLYDFGNDGTIDFLSGTYSGLSDGIAKEISYIHELFTMDESGNFKPQSDKNGEKYFIKRTFKAKNFVEFDKKFAQYWVEEIK
jgi:hypothetical protein